MTNNTTTYVILVLCLIALFLACCRPPLNSIDNKSKYFKSTKTKNIESTTGKINTTGTFITQDTTCNRPIFLMMKFNADQTVQVSSIRDNITKALILDSVSYLNYLDNKVSYYFFIDKKSQTLTLERFEYWDAPFWNIFVQTNHYLVEKFNISGDTLTNQVNDRFSRFGRKYILDKSLVKNFHRIENEFTTKPE
jgi:hypothetical protein